MTVSAFCSVSLKPNLVLICLQSGSQTERMIRESSAFAVNILSQGQESLAKRFARAEERQTRFSGISYSANGDGLPVLNNCLGYVKCKVTSSYDQGSHTIFIGEVTALGYNQSPLQPLLYFRRKYGALDEH